MPSLRRFLEELGVSATNNVSERGMGRTKVRTKTVCGLGSEEGALNLTALTQWRSTSQASHDLGEVVAERDEPPAEAQGEPASRFPPTANEAVTRQELLDTY